MSSVTLLAYATLSTLNSDGSQPLNTYGQVINDPVKTNNGLYQWNGSVWLSYPAFERVETNAVARSLVDKARDIVSVRDFGAKGDGMNDDGPAIQHAIDACKRVHFPVGVYSIGPTTGIGLVLPEDAQLIGTGSSIATTTGDGFTSIIYAGTGSAISVLGTVSPNSPRRNIRIEGMNISCSGGGTAINATYMTFFTIVDVYTLGANLACGLSCVNCFDGEIRHCRFSGATASNMYFGVSSDSMDNVFSGQTLVSSCDFWSSTAGEGLKVDRPSLRNDLEQLVLLKCHFKGNATGLHLVTGGVTLYTPHFEANTTSDVVAEIDNPFIIGFYCNNSMTTGKVMDFRGTKGCLKSGRFTEVQGGATCVDISGSGMEVGGIEILEDSGNTFTGISVGGANNSIHDIVFDVNGTTLTGISVGGTNNSLHDVVFNLTSAMTSGISVTGSNNSLHDVVFNMTTATTTGISVSGATNSLHDITFNVVGVSAHPVFGLNLTSSSSGNTIYTIRSTSTQNAIVTDASSTSSAPEKNTYLDREELSLTASLVSGSASTASKVFGKDLWVGNVNVLFVAATNQSVGGHVQVGYSSAPGSSSLTHFADITTTTGAVNSWTSKNYNSSFLSLFYLPAGNPLILTNAGNGTLASGTGGTVVARVQSYPYNIRFT